MTGIATSEAAPAKINLALHVTGQRADGYHLLDSIVAFAGEGDLLRFSPAEEDAFRLSGRFGPHLSEESTGHDGNLVLKARDLLRATLAAHGQPAPPVAIELEKNLPVASGIGGGSADAAATLRGLMRFWGATPPADTLGPIALKLGADVPMCLEGRPLRARGIGEQIDMLRSMPRFDLVLGNPLKGVSTPDIFRRLATKDNAPIGEPPASGSTEDWIAFLAARRNDLEGPARALLPEIGALAEMLRSTGARLVRMSGSGATCFGVYENREAAASAQAELCRMRPDWYFAATETNGTH